MKKLFKSTKISLLLVGLLSSVAWTKTPQAIVSSIIGHAFVMSDGITKTLRKGDRIEDYSDVVTEEGAQITITDYYDHKYHLSGSGHIKLEHNQIELERGYFWLQSYNQTDKFIIKTANAKIDYTFGEAIVSFDPYGGKTQILSVKGDFDLANSLETHLTVNVSDGQFSFVANDYEKGIPRVPMQIGESSFRKITGLFGGVSPMTPDSLPIRRDVVPKRGIASAPIHISKKVERPKEINVSSLYKEKLQVAKQIKHKQLLKEKYGKKSGVVVRIFGQKSEFVGTVGKKTTDKTASRLPASVATPVVVPSDRGTFESSLVKEYGEQMRHDKEVNQLIDELKNYDQDYQISY